MAEAKSEAKDDQSTKAVDDDAGEKQGSADVTEELLLLTRVAQFFIRYDPDGTRTSTIVRFFNATTSIAGRMVDMETRNISVYRAKTPAMNGFRGNKHAGSKDVVR